ncbi:MAG TPA: nuclear transport factor 2 family protein [Candidatus Acidoferrum sp.]|nr:nuclear transport factor 2 family protein [Candidatus Acidoferrum sp.]
MKRYRFVTSALLLSLMLGGTLAYLSFGSIAVSADDMTVVQSDHEFVQAAAKGDTSTVGRLVDTDFTWTDAEGKTRNRAEVLASLPTPALGNEAGAELKQQLHSQVGAVMSGRDKTHVLRIWVKRPSGWRLLVYQEVVLGRHASGPGGSGVKECQNPCKTLPYKPKNEAEQAIIASWQALETGVTNHDASAWAPHIAEEFVMLGSNNDHPLGKADRIATLNLQKQTGFASAPAPLVSAQMFDFGDAVVMTCQHQPYTGKPVHVSRLWIKRNGQWVMSISYQTTMQAAPSKSS